jgi:membrane fusion protein (multidrug efflux system)
LPAEFFILYTSYKAAAKAPRWFSNGEKVGLAMNAVSNRQQIQVVSDAEQSVAPPRRKFLTPSHRTLLVAVAAVAVAIAGSAYIVAPPSHESTDDAYVGADVTTVAPKVRGLVAEILVRDNQTVHAGDPLVRIDPEEFDAKVASAKADLGDAEAGVASARAALTSLDAEERLAAANVVAAQTSIRSANAQAARANADRRRYEELVPTGAVARREADLYKAAAITAEQDAARSVAMYDVSQRAQSVTEAKRATLEAALEKAQATVQRARATLDLALQDERHAVVLAPIDGVVGNRQAQPGDYVQPGSRLMTLVPLGAVYVTANFKETQTVHMQPGQRATISVDALTGDDLKGTVESFAPGSGSTFSLLPFEPGTGNFTKIVQRVPVRIRFDANQAGIARLRPGLSVTARVDFEK